MVPWFMLISCQLTTPQLNGTSVLFAQKEMPRIRIQKYLCLTCGHIFYRVRNLAAFWKGILTRHVRRSCEKSSSKPLARPRRCVIWVCSTRRSARQTGSSHSCGRSLEHRREHDGLCFGQLSLARCAERRHYARCPGVDEKVDRSALACCSARVWLSVTRWMLRNRMLSSQRPSVHAPFGAFLSFFASRILNNPSSILF